MEVTTAVGHKRLGCDNSHQLARLAEFSRSSGIHLQYDAVTIICLDEFIYHIVSVLMRKINYLGHCGKIARIWDLFLD